jgi:hypothetical protein
MTTARCRFAGRSIAAMAAVVLAAACADGSRPVDGAARVAGIEETATTSAIPPTTSATSRVVWPFDTKVPSEVLALLEPQESLYGYVVMPDASLILGTAVGGGTAYRCRTSLLRIDPTSRVRTKIASGILPTLSPDGSKLAYAQQRAPSESEPSECGIDDIGIRTVETGLTITPDIPRVLDERLAAFALRWSPDSMRLRFYVGYENSDGVSGPIVVDLTTNSTTVVALDPSVQDDLSVQFAPHVPARDWEVVSGVWLSDGSLAVAVSCGMGCLDGMPRDAHPAWYRVDADYVLRSLSQRVGEPHFVAELERCIGITYC